MARRFYSSSYLDRSWSSPVAVPISVSLWVRFDPIDIGTASGIFYIGNSANNDRFLIGKSAADTLQIFTNLSVANPTITVVADRWYHVCGVWTSTTAWALYADGVLDASYSSTAVTPSGVNRLAIGGRWSNGNIGLHVRGSIAWPAIWNVALTTREVSALASGTPPHMIRPTSLREAWRLRGDSNLIEPGLVRGLDLSVNNAAWWPDPYPDQGGLYGGPQNSIGLAPAVVASQGAGEVSLWQSVAFQFANPNLR